MPRPLPYTSRIARTPLLPAALSLTAGIAAGEALWPATQGALLLFALAAAAALIAGIALPRALRPKAERGGMHTAARALPHIARCAALVLIGLALITHARQRLCVAPPAQPATYTLRASTSTTARARTLGITATIAHGALRGQRVQLALQRPDSGCPTPQPGDRLIVTAQLEAPRHSGNPHAFDYATYLRHQGIALTAYAPADHWRMVPAEGAGSPLRAAPLTLRERALRYRERLLLQYHTALRDADLAVLSALTLGDKSGLDAATRSTFAQSGASHVLALSGLHLAILFGLYQLLLVHRLRSKRLRAAASVAGLAGVWCFVLLAGLPLSLARAATMFTLTTLALALQLRATAAGNLTVAALATLVLSPQALFDVGFQLSYLSVLGITQFTPHLTPRDPWQFARTPRWPARAAAGVWQMLAVSLSALLATAPLVAYHFHTFPLYAAVANLVVIPLTYALLTAALCFLLLPAIQPLLSVPLSLLLQTLSGTTAAISSLPHAALTLHPSALTTALVYLALATLLLHLRHHTPRTTHALGFALAATLVSALNAARPGRLAPQIVLYNLRPTAALHLIATPTRSYLATPDAARAQPALTTACADFWQAEGIAPPHILPATAPRCAPHLVSHPPLYTFCGYRLALLPTAQHDTATAPPQQATPPLHRATPPPLRTTSPLHRTTPPPHRATPPLIRATPNRTARPLPVNALILARGYTAPLTDALRLFSPQLVVLHNSLPRSRRDELKRECAARGIAHYDVDEKGAWIVPLSP